MTCFWGKREAVAPSTARLHSLCILKEACLMFTNKLPFKELKKHHMKHYTWKCLGIKMSLKEKRRMNNFVTPWDGPKHKLENHHETGIQKPGTWCPNGPREYWYLIQVLETVSRKFCLELVIRFHVTDMDPYAFTNKSLITLPCIACTIVFLPPQMLTH